MMIHRPGARPGRASPLTRPAWLPLSIRSIPQSTHPLGWYWRKILTMPRPYSVGRSVHVGWDFGELFWNPASDMGAGGRRQRWCCQIWPTNWKVEKVSPTGVAQLVVASGIFLAAAATAKHYALAPSLLRMARRLASTR